MEKQIVFRGKKFNWDGKYYCPSGGHRNGNKRLHQEIWISHNGEIPQGFHIHHKDGDTKNNNISNLCLIEVNKHLSEHFKKNWEREEFRKKILDNCDRVRHLTKEWHASKDGADWHSKHGKEAWIDKKQYTKLCEVCNKEYKTYFPNRSRFCHQNCKAKEFRKRWKLNGTANNSSRNPNRGTVSS